MSNVSLQDFCNRMVEAGCVTCHDVRMLTGEILPDGIETREEIDMLLALDRTVEVDTRFADYLVAATVDFAVWGERPTGHIDRGTAEWLAASIRGRSGPTRTGARIAMEIVREAQGSHESLIVFALEANRWTRGPAVDRPPFALAA